MAMTDYFKSGAVEKIKQTKTTNAHGNMKVVDSIISGSAMDGLLVNRSRSDRVVGAQRSKNDDKYNLFVYADATLEKDDKVRYTYSNGDKVYLRITSGAILNEEASGQTEWKTYEAETYVPTGGLS